MSRFFIHRPIFAWVIALLIVLVGVLAGRGLPVEQYPQNNNKIQVRHVTTAGTYHGQWIVTDGISDGDRVVIMGGTKVKPEQEVTVRELPPTGSSANGAPVQAEDTPVVVPRADKSTNQAH